MILAGGRRIQIFRLWCINGWKYWEYVKCILMEECWDVRFSTVTLSRIRLSTKAYGRQRSCWCEDWGLFQPKAFAFGLSALYHSYSLERKHQFSGEKCRFVLRICSLLDVISVYPQEEEKSIWFLHNETRRPLYIQGLSKRFEHLLLWPPRSPDLTPCDFFL